MRFLIPATIVAITMTAAARADTDYSALIADQGLEGAANTLDALPDPTASDLYALGGIRFLRAAEVSVQMRYMTALDSELMDRVGLPLLRLPVGESPDAQPFQPALIEDLLTAALGELALSIEALEQIGDDDTVSVVIAPDDLWFDMNMNGTRDAGEGVFDSFAGAAGFNPNLGMTVTIDDGQPDNPADMSLPEIHFDTADAAWLAAYAHLVSATSEGLLALDPTTAITRVTESRGDMLALSNGQGTRFFTPEDDWFVDNIAVVIHILEGPVDADHSRAAHAHLTAMIDHNQVFWSRVSMETDDDREWIPNKTQTSAIGLPFPAGIGDSWRAVLADAEALLNGDLLLPYWRISPAAGLDLNALMQNPPEIDLIGLIQGGDLLPYMRQGRVIDWQSLEAFDRIAGSDAGLYAVILN